MINVRLVDAVPGMEELAEKTQSRFHVSATADTCDCVLRVSTVPDVRFYRVKRARGVLVSTWQSEGICTYAGLPQAAYFLTAGMLGLVQWRTLQLNPLLVEEDFLHPPDSNCLFATREYKEDYALPFARPHICRACLEFYRSLGTEPEVEALLRTLRALKSMRPRMSSEYFLSPLP